MYNYLNDNTAADESDISAALAAAAGASMVGFIQDGTQPTPLSIESALRELPSVTRFTAGRSDETTALTNAFQRWPVVWIPPGATVPVANFAIPDGCTLVIDGVLQMASGAPQGAAIIKPAANSTGWRIVGSGRLDGNRAKQSGNAYQSLIYAANASGVQVALAHATQNYFPSSIDVSIDIGAIHFEGGQDIDVSIRALVDYGREGIFLHECRDSSVHDSQTYGGADSWSGVQVGGTTSTRNSIRGVRAMYAGASAIGCDSKDSQIIGCMAYANRYFHGFNLGHAGQPSDGTVLMNCYSENAGTEGASTTEHDGFCISNGTQNVRLIGCRAKNAYKHAFNVSSGANNVRLFDCEGTGARAGYGLNSYGAYIEATDCDFRGNLGGAYLRGSGSTESFRNVRLSDDPMFGYTAINGLVPGSGITVSNANILQSMLPSIMPGNAATQTAGVFLKTINDKNFVVDFLTVPGGGAGFRWRIG